MKTAWCKNCLQLAIGKSICNYDAIVMWVTLITGLLDISAYYFTFTQFNQQKYENVVIWIKRDLPKIEKISSQQEKKKNSPSTTAKIQKGSRLAKINSRKFSSQLKKASLRWFYDGWKKYSTARCDLFSVTAIIVRMRA